LLSLNCADFIDRPPNGQRQQPMENTMRKNGEKAFRGIAGLLSLLALSGMFFTDGAVIRIGRGPAIRLMPVASAKGVLHSARSKDNPADKSGDTSASTLRLRKIGERKALVFSPDFAATGNRQFYEGLAEFNHAHPEDSIREIFMEAHGSNGNGLKLQKSQLRSAPRSYISLGALQERLQNAGVERAILTACNTGRLFRPEIYKKLNMRVKDPTVLPATLGVVNASADFDPSSCAVELVRRTDSRIEQTSEGRFQELPASVRRALSIPSSPEPFTVSNMFIQMVIKDVTLQLTSTGFVRKVSSSTESESLNESIFQNFLKFLDDVASDRSSPPPVQASSDGGGEQ
jgi:hypothetical protein